MKSNVTHETTNESRIAAAEPEEQAVPINGLEQIIEMFRYADPVFRNSLLKRIQARDPALARKLARIR
jgi:hypothetical protein